MKIRSYFTSFPLKTKKKESFHKWIKVHDMVITKQHLTTDGLIIISSISKTINLANSVMNKTGSIRLRYSPILPVRVEFIIII